MSKTNDENLFFYILVDPDKTGYHKVGITKNPEQRIKSYRTAAPGAYFHKIYEIESKKNETDLLYELSGAFRVRSEVVKGPLNIIQNIVEGYLEEKNLLG
jgi:hypothetical protein